ncbi:IS66 family insertion sequence element accessory protein TnpA [Lunatimonas salinarum]|uniref:IS66 family insertion sequence element accessory protein TnpA n=1 Tax=Lunatimonas salinarum TaxID=1774590 RepID=UPI001ADEDD6A|nr:hypothetical protein [Lunatimonas salinarum]
MKDFQAVSPRDYYRSLYEDWKASGISVGVFCRQASVKYATFRYWSKKFAREDQNLPGFTELRLNGAESAPVAVLSFPNGASISFIRLPDTGWLRELIG